MAFNVNFGNIIEDFTNSLNEAFGLRSNSVGEKGGAGLFNKDFFGSVDFDRSNWVGNSGPFPKDLRYGFAIVRPAGSSGDIKAPAQFSEDSEDLFLLQVAPQQIQQKEIFATNIQATRKGVIVESEGVVFKDIILSGNTGVFPGERGSSTSPTPSLSNLTNPPSAPAGVDPETGLSKRTGVKTISGYEEFQRLRQFFLKYAKQKVDTSGGTFLAFINQKDNQYLIVEPLEFVMERNARSPMTYDYRITMKAIALLSDVQAPKAEADEAISLLDQISNSIANVVAIVDSATEVLNAARGSLISITQGIDNLLFTPLRQTAIALRAQNAGINESLAVPAILFRGGQGAVSDLQLAVAEAKGSVGSVIANYASSQRAVIDATASTLGVPNNTPRSTTGIITDEFGNITGTGTGSSTSDTPSFGLTSPQDANTINGETPNLTPEQFVQVQEISADIDASPNTPIPRSFIQSLKTNTETIRDDFADSIGVGDEGYDEIFGRTVTQIAPPLAVPTDDQFLILGALQDLISALDYLLCNNAYFQADADAVYQQAQQTYGAIATISQPDNVREVTINSGDTLERIALREYGDALRWVDLVVLNKLKSPYILDTTDEVEDGVRRPGDKILIGV
jgi:nucleoid-associated protein YgaU